MLAMQLQIRFRNAVRVSHVVVDSRSRQSVCAGTIFLSPTNRRVDRHVCYVDTLRHHLPCHALCEPGLGVTCHCKGSAGRKAFERCAGVREDDRSFRAVSVELVSEYESSRLLTHQKCAERRVSEGFERHDRVGFDDALAENARNPAIDIVDDKPRCPDVYPAGSVLCSIRATMRAQRPKFGRSSNGPGIFRSTSARSTDITAVRLARSRQFHQDLTFRDFATGPKRRQARQAAGAGYTVSSGRRAQDHVANAIPVPVPAGVRCLVNDAADQFERELGMFRRTMDRVHGIALRHPPDPTGRLPDTHG